MQKPNYYAVIPADVRYNKNLSPNSKLLYAEITALCNMNGKCTASTQYFCKLYEVSRVSIQKWLKILEDNNYIKRVNIYKPDSKQIEARVITLVNSSIKEKLTDNNKINNTNITYSNKKELFKKPSVYEIEFYCEVKEYKIDAEAFYDFYQSKNWMVGKNKMKDWKAAVRTWHRRDYKKPTMSKLDSQISAWQEAKKLL